MTTNVPEAEVGAAGAASAPRLPVDGPAPSETNHLKLNGRCHECTKPIPPMRRLCGRCSARREA